MEPSLEKLQVQKRILTWKQVVGILIVMFGCMALGVVLYKQSNIRFITWYNGSGIIELSFIIGLILYRPTRAYLMSSWSIRALIKWTNYAWLIGGFVLMIFLCSWLFQIPLESTWDILSSPISQYPLAEKWQIVLFLLGTGVIAPVFEEALFRGIIYRKLYETRGMVIGLFVSSLTFTFAHFSMSLSYTIEIFVFGILLAIIYQFTRSLSIPILLHGAWNIFAAFYFNTL
ncbi:CPBP family intramembrane glutamic endopeptidase [Fictibacillus phosphorivorans]|uniref:CPBP family intramembrane glutamic endopeptidase n=1 Tax=Fictibacillus phosphorivorans TaxID=1221500 RepID=UPI0016428E0D|nr:CPBP family intramembrane glutamic endopeptidase [Fictibacillus phosphorivorans]